MCRLVNTLGTRGAVLRIWSNRYRSEPVVITTTADAEEIEESQTRWRANGWDVRKSEDGDLSNPSELSLLVQQQCVLWTCSDCC